MGSERKRLVAFELFVYQLVGLTRNDFVAYRRNLVNECLVLGYSYRESVLAIALGVGHKQVRYIVRCNLILILIRAVIVIDD